MIYTEVENCLSCDFCMQSFIDKERLAHENDRYHHCSYFDKSAEELRALAATEGWRRVFVKGQYRDICPLCLAAKRDEEWTDAAMERRQGLPGDAYPTAHRNGWPS